MTRFAPLYAARIYPDVPEENRTLTAVGVDVMIVSNGDQELAIAAAPFLGVKPENVVGSNLVYGPDGRSFDYNHSYEILDWPDKPQPGKILSLHYLLRTSLKRFSWDHIAFDKFVIAGRDGDSASSDGGMMIFGRRLQSVTLWSTLRANLTVSRSSSTWPNATASVNSSLWFNAHLNWDAGRSDVAACCQQRKSATPQGIFGSSLLVSIRPTHA